MGKTKAEEREALVKIGQILEDFSPEDTYIGKAFEDCVEQAETNLCNDWMQSWKDRYDRVLEQFHAANARLMDVTRQLNQKDDAIARLEDAKNQLEQDASRMPAGRMLSWQQQRPGPRMRKRRTTGSSTGSWNSRQNCMT